MAFELVYTSAPRGIKPGSSGFCTVAYTNGLAANTAVQLEALSAYKAYFPPYDDHASQNPVAYSHYRVISSGEELHVLSRICFNGLDYTKRSNKLAHHLVLRHYDLAQAPAGPAALFQQPGLFFCAWDREPLLFPRQKDIAATDAGIGPAATWEAYTGDAGWAGTLVERYLQAPDRPVYIIFDPLQHHDVLSLLAEAALLLPPADRWQLTFNTYFTTLPAGISCAWRFCVPNADALREARRSPGTLIIDLTQKMPAAPAGKWQNLARSAIVPPDPKAAVLPTPAGNDPADQLRATAPKATADATKLKATAARPAASGTSARASAPYQAPVSKRRLLVPAVIGAMILLLLVAGGGIFALKQARNTANEQTADAAPSAQQAAPDESPADNTAPQAAGTESNATTAADAGALTQRAAATTPAPASPQAPATATGAPQATGDITSAASQQSSAPNQHAAQPPQAHAAGTTDSPQQQAPPPAVTPATETPPPPNFSCLDLRVERDRSYLWLLNFMGHFTSIDVMLENSDEKIVAALIRNQMVTVTNDKIAILGGGMTSEDKYSLTYSGRKVTITKTECKCSDGDGKNNDVPCCTHALLGFKTTSGKEYLTYPVLGHPVIGTSKIPDVNMDGSPADLACTLSYCAVDNMSVPANPNLFRIELTSPLKDYLKKFLAKLQIGFPNALLVYVFHLPDGSEITTTTTTTTTATTNDIQNSKFFEPYHKALADLTQKRNMPTEGKNLEDDNKRREAKEQAVAQAIADLNTRGKALVQALAQGKLSLCIDYRGQRYVIKDDISIRTGP